jgi:hypothetical protein
MSIAHLSNPFLLLQPCLLHRGHFRCFCSLVFFALPFRFSWATTTDGLGNNVQYSRTLKDKYCTVLYCTLLASESQRYTHNKYKPNRSHVRDLHSSSNSQLYTLQMENTQSLIFLRQSRSSERHRLEKRAEPKTPRK